MNSLLKLFGSDTLLAAALELIIGSQIDNASTAAGRAFTVPASVVSQLCSRFGVRSATGQQAVIDAFRNVGASVSGVVGAIAANRSSN